VAGADTDYEAAFAAGATYIYSLGTDGLWSEEAKLLPSDLDPTEFFFGTSVAIRDDWIAVGAIKAKNDAGVVTGATYMFHHESDGSWLQTAKLLASDGANGDSFGWAIVLDGDRLLVGAPGIGDQLGGIGGGYIFERQLDDNWIQTGELLPTGGPTTSVGQAAALSGDIAVLGGPGTYLTRGATYGFQSDGAGVWTQQAILTPPGSPIGYQFGWAVATDGTQVFSGANFDSSYVSDGGAVYVHNILCTCPGDLNADGTVDLTDLATLLAHYGETSAPPADGDLNGDGTIDLTDLAALLAVYGTNCT
jgi:hypothetical protein